MGLMREEVERLAGKWRGLARLALDCVTPGPAPQPFERLKTEAHDALNWQSPLPGYHDAFVLFALARLGAAFAKSSYEACQKRAPALRALSELVLDMLGEKPEPPRPPFRADIDG